MAFFRTLCWWICLLPGLAWGQRLSFCAAHSPEGKPIGASNNFDLKQSGDPVEFVFQAAEPMISPKLYFFIDRWEDERYVEYDTKTHIPEHGSRWAALQYRFTRSGTYRVLVLNADKQELCRNEVQVRVAEDEDSPEYFEGATILVCSAAPKGIPIDTLDTYLIRTGQVPRLSILLKHNRPLAMNRLLADVWLGSGDEGPGLFLETIELHVRPEWTYTQFKYEFGSYGVYTFRLYNEQEVYIGTARVSMESR
jgi:hypothetical protein